MKYEIEVYKGQTIEYDDETDKFVCEININDNTKHSKRGSLNDLRKEIDTYIKNNLEFKPFKALLKDKYGDGFDIYDIKGIRTDGQFIIQKIGYNHTSLASFKDMERCMIYDQSFVDEFKSLNRRKEKFNNYIKERIKTLSAKLIPADLSQFEKILIKSEQSQD